MNDINVTETETETEMTDAVTAENLTTETDSSPVELEAYKKIHEEDKAELERLRKELEQTKIANAKLAIRQSISAPIQSPEEILNDMFK